MYKLNSSTAYQAQVASLVTAPKLTPQSPPVTVAKLSQRALPALEVDIITSSEQLKHLESDWNELSAQMKQHAFFQTFAWAWSWWEHLGQNMGYQLRVITLRQSDRTVLIWPLVQRRQGPWQVASWLGAESGQYADVLLAQDVEPAVVLDLAWRTLKDELKLDVLQLSDVRADSVIAPYLAEKIGKPEISGASPYCDINEWQDWDALYAGLKRKFRKDLGRCRRRLQEQGELSFELIDQAEAIPDIIAQSLQHKQGWLKERGLYGRFLERPETQDWLTQVALTAHKNQSLALTVFKLDNKLIATTLSFLHRNHLYAYFGSFDLEFTRYSAGMLQTEDTLKWAMEQNLAAFDLMPPNDRYKLNWAKHETDIHTYTDYSSVWGQGAKFWYHSGGREFALNLYHSLPRTLRQSVSKLVGS